MDGQLNAKVADLELGGDTMTAVDKDFDLNVDMNTFRKPLSFNKNDVTAIVQSLNPIVKPNANKRDDIQTTWMAPEVRYSIVLVELFLYNIPVRSCEGPCTPKSRTCTRLV